MHTITVEQSNLSLVLTEHRPATAVNTIIGTKVELAAAALKALLDPTLETHIEVFTKGEGLRLEKLNKYLSLIGVLGYSIRKNQITGAFTLEDNTIVPEKEEKTNTQEEKKPAPVAKPVVPIQLGVPLPVVPTPAAPVPVTPPAPVEVPVSQPVASDPANDFAPIGDPAQAPEPQANTGEPTGAQPPAEIQKQAEVLPVQVPAPAPVPAPQQQITRIVGDAGMSVSL